MLRVLLLFISLLASTTTMAWTLEAKIVAGPNGLLQDQAALYCRPDETLCNFICKNDSSCVKEQELCYNCLGTANPILRTVFTEVDRLYSNTQQVATVSDVANVFNKNHVYIAARSIYNFFTSLENEDVQKRFQNLCPTNTPSPILVLAKNKNNEPTQIKYVICEGSGSYNQDMYILAYDPQVEINLRRP